MAQLPSIHSCQLGMSPCVVCAAKSGTMFPRRSTCESSTGREAMHGAAQRLSTSKSSYSWHACPRLVTRTDIIKALEALVHSRTVGIQPWLESMSSMAAGPCAGIDTAHPVRRGLRIELGVFLNARGNGRHLQ